ncbi:diacylglycerol kinase [Campylobacter sp. MG1]|uniref:diacylglycerol kinase n=1 Tax=Campylobacter sp. MG1 TaxID=2976332 RepID=UPI00226CCBE2|nr:diacylglycerol kinase [Campylobacter sp. MG1]
MKKRYSFLKNASYAIAGIKRAFKESAFKLELFCALPFLLFAILYDFDIYDKILLIFSIVLVFISECFNTAIECVVDLVTKKYELLAKEAKDLASAGVFLTICMAIFVWIMILYKEFL